MPETISFWVALVSSVGSLLLGSVGGGLFKFGWVLRGLKRDVESAVSGTNGAVDAVRYIRDQAIPDLVARHNDLAQTLSGFGERLGQMSEEHEEMRDLVLLKLPNMVEGAISRAAESASKAAWHRKRRS